MYLEDIERIRQLKYRYFRGIDTADIELLRGVLAEDVHIDYHGGTYRWQVEGRESMLAAIAAAFNEHAVACHTGHHPEIEVLTPTTATGIWYLTDVFINLREKLVHDRQRALQRRVRQAGRRLADKVIDVQAALRDPGNARRRHRSSPRTTWPGLRVARRSRGRPRDELTADCDERTRTDGGSADRRLGQWRVDGRVVRLRARRQGCARRREDASLRRHERDFRRWHLDSLQSLRARSRCPGQSRRGARIPARTIPGQCAFPTRCSRPIVREGPRMLDFLHERTRVRYESLAHYPDYWSFLPGAQERPPLDRARAAQPRRARRDGPTLRATHHMICMRTASRSSRSRRTS